MDLKLVLTPPKRRRSEQDLRVRTSRIEEGGKQPCLIHFDLYEKETKTRTFTAKSWDKVKWAK